MNPLTPRPENPNQPLTVTLDRKGQKLEVSTVPVGRWGWKVQSVHLDGEPIHNLSFREGRRVNRCVASRSTTYTE